ncbi:MULTISPECIES: hypothetical protein [Pseudomonas]|uniref:hypothetical protein n=1 Tax=Pseudomonas TaxID=286 RepID=UPI000A1E4687|nr:MULTISPECIES: hypothetical protein [Pseudomonas]MCX4218622.1 hypothetical protein [Pseudomonas sp. MCal1]UDI93178.1 hypothetical protein I5961_01070 [Pseudomonas sp. IAC-BECa141]UIN56718.1 hypothetical protein LXN51_10395 [Pseudomonas kribbensis]
MPRLDVDGLFFSFPEEWRASKFDEWGYYRNHFLKQRDKIKAIDILVLSPENTAFLVEVKDYRHPQAVKPSDLPEAIANKVFCTLAALLPARLHASTEDDERELSRDVLNCQRLQIVVHIEQPQAHLPKVDLADVKQKLKKLLRAIDAHPKIVSMTKPQGMVWSVSAR